MPEGYISHRFTATKKSISAAEKVMFLETLLGPKSIHSLDFGHHQTANGVQNLLAAIGCRGFLYPKDDLLDDLMFY